MVSIKILNLDLILKNRIHINLSFSLSFSIVMELADGGDVFQKILNHKKQKTYIKERYIW